ncbi:MAG: 1,4-dihydroxy-2-naphthoate octaprenyltransferase [Candidatus Brocadiia bacterium]
MRRLRLWIKAVRAPFFTATICPIVLGATIGWYQTGHFNWIYFWLTLMGGILMHTGTNLTNDYFDHITGNDWVNRIKTPFSGGSRVIQQGEIPAGQILLVALGAFALGGLIGLYLNHNLAGNMILAFGIIGVFLGFFYTALPVKIGYRGFGLGELAVGIGFGPVMVLGAYYVQAEQITAQAVFASIPVGILITLVLYINEFPDYAADKSVNKMTLPVHLGKRAASRLYIIVVIANYILIVAGVVSGIMPAWTLVTLFTLPVAIKAMRTVRVHFDRIQELLPANGATIVLHFSIGLLLAAGFILDKLT